jgi:hypothetical protein
MQRLYLLYLNGCHEKVVHSFSTLLETETETNKKLGREKEIEIISMVYGQRRVPALMKIDIQAGTGQNQPCRTMLTSWYLP